MGLAISTTTSNPLRLKAEAPGLLCEVRWYAACTSAHHEKKVAVELGRRSVECYLPLYSSVRRWKDRQVRMKCPLFPSYVFVRLALAERLRVLQVPGVVRKVGFSMEGLIVRRKNASRLVISLELIQRAMAVLDRSNRS